MATPAPSRSRRPKFAEIGATGLRVWGGRVYEEWLPELVGERGRRVIREMAEQDPVIGGIFFAIENLCRQVQWTFTPRDESEKAVEVAEFAQECLADMHPHWPDTTSEILTMLPYGWSFFEVVYKYRSGPQDDPAMTSLWDDGKIGWKTWAIRGQETLLNWEYDEAGKLTGLTQNPPPKYQTLTIPIKKALHFRTKSRKDNPEGVSILRSAYRPWYFKKHIEQIEGIGVERDLAGLPVMWVPPELLAPNATEEQKLLLAELQKIVTNIRRDEQEGVIMPLSYDESGKEAYRLQLISTGGQRQFDTDKIIQRYDQRIAMTMLADFILLGHEAVGSFALSDSKTALFATALGAWLDSISATVTRVEMPRLLKLNGYDPKLVPKLSHSDIENADLGKLGTYLQSLASAGMTIFPNPAVEKHLFEQAGLPVPEEMPSQTEAMVNQALQDMGLTDAMGNPLPQEPPPDAAPPTPSGGGSSPATLRQKNRTSPQSAAEAAGTPMRTPKGFAASEEAVNETEQFFNPLHSKRTGRFDFNPMGTGEIVGGSLVKQFGGQAAAIRELHNRGKRPAEIARLLGVRPQAVHGQLAKVRAKAAAAAAPAGGGIGHPNAPSAGIRTQHGGFQHVGPTSAPPKPKLVSFNPQPGTTTRGMAARLGGVTPHGGAATSHGGRPGGIHGQGHFGTGPATAAKRGGGPSIGPAALQTTGHRRAMAAAKIMAPLNKAAADRQRRSDIQKVDIADVANARRAKRGMAPLRDRPSEAAARGRVGPKQPGGAPLTSHGGEAGHWQRPGTKVGGGVEPRQVLGHGRGHTARAGEPVKGAQVVGTALGRPGKIGQSRLGETGAVRLKGQHLQDQGVQTRRGSTGDVQRVRVFKTSHGGQVEVGQGSAGSVQGAGVMHGTGHKQPRGQTPAPLTSHGGKGTARADQIAIQQGIPGTAHGPGHGRAGADALQRRADVQKVQARAAGTATLQRVKAQPVDVMIPGQALAKGAAQRRLDRKAAARAGAVGAPASAKVKVPAKGGTAVAGSEKLEISKQEAHIAVVDATGHGKLAGPITNITRNPNAGIDGSYVGMIGGTKVCIKPVSEQARAQSYVGPDGAWHHGHGRTNLTDGNGHGRAAAAYLVSERMGMGVPKTTIRDTPKGKAEVIEWLSQAPAGVGRPGGITQQHALFDMVIGNTDRHGRNQLDMAGKLIPIDHALAFPDKKGGSGGNYMWANAHSHKPLDPESKRLLGDLQKNEKAVRGELEPLVGKAAVNLMYGRVNYMVKSGYTLSRDQMQGANLDHERGVVVPKMNISIAPAGRGGGAGGGAHRQGPGGLLLARRPAGGRGGRQQPAGPGTKARRNAGEFKQRQEPRNLTAGARGRVAEARNWAVIHGLPDRAKAMGVQDHQRRNIRVNRRGNIGWWVGGPGHWKWVDLNPRNPAHPIGNGFGQLPPA